MSDEMEYLYENPGEELHQDLDSGRAFRKKISEDTSVPSISGPYTGPGSRPDGLARGIGGSVAKPEQQARQHHMTHDEMMRAADKYIAEYQAITPDPADKYSGALRLEHEPENYYAPPESKGPPDWLTQYMENLPSTGTIVVDQLGNQRYMNERQRLRALRDLRDK